MEHDVEDIAFASLGDDEKTYDSSYICQFPREFCIDDAANFKAKFKPHLITSIGEFQDLTGELQNTWVAGDTETNGVDYDQHRICGFSFSTTPYNGFYVPIRHQNQEKNLPEEEIVPLIHEFLYRNKWLFYHWEFDGMMMKRDGCALDRVTVLDVRALVYNADTNIKRNNLKWAAKWFLNRESPTFEETTGGKDITFDMLEVEEAYDYACQDTANTFGVFKVLFKPLMSLCPTTIRMDNRLACAMAEYYADNEIHLDNHEMERLGRELRVQRDTLAREIMRDFKRTMQNPINLNSGDQVAAALLSLGLNTGQMTDTGQMSVNKEALAKLDHPVAEKLIEYSHIQKQLNSYVDKLSNVDRGHINYKTFFNTTGRLASGSDGEKNPFYLPLNYQNMTKPTMQLYRREFIGDDPDNVELILGYRFTPITEEESKDFPSSEILEGPSPTLNVRRAITVPDGDRKNWYFVSMDYSQEELVVIGCMSRDPVYLKAFKNKEDIYRTVGSEMFGVPPSEITKAQRKKAKVAVLGLNYGGSYWTLMKSSKLPREECKEIESSYRKATHVMEQWKSRSVARAHNEYWIEWLGSDDLEPNSERNLTRKSSAYPISYLTRTAYGRPRFLGHWLGSPDEQLRKFGIRTVTSHQVQGTSGDVMRIVMWELYQQLFKKYPNEIRFVGCVHDEVDIVVRKNSMGLLDEVKRIMSIAPPGCEFPLPVDPEIGYSYGYLFPFKKNEQGAWR